MSDFYEEADIRRSNVRRQAEVANNLRDFWRNWYEDERQGEAAFNGYAYGVCTVLQFPEQARYLAGLLHEAEGGLWAMPVEEIEEKHRKFLVGLMGHEEAGDEDSPLPGC